MEEIKNKPSNYYVGKSRKISDFILGFLISIAIGYIIFFKGLFLDNIFPTENVAYGPGPVRDFLIVILPLAIFYLAIRIPLGAKRSFFIWGFLLPYATFFVIWFFLLLYGLTHPGIFRYW